MKERGYKARVDCYETANGNMTIITFTDGAKALLKKPFVSMCRVNNRLFFIPKDDNRSQGSMKVGDLRIQFGRSQEHKEALDFRGEYDEVHINEKGNVFLVLEEKRPYETTKKGSRGTQKPSQKRVNEATVKEEADVPTGASLGELLVAEIEKTKAEIASLLEEKANIEESLKKMEDLIEYKEQARKNFEAALLSIDITGRYG